MKKLKNKKLIDIIKMNFKSNYSYEMEYEDLYYHLFCSLFLGYHKDVVNVEEF
jgi:hypothetical protein